jgi:hypothetical protein
MTEDKQPARPYVPPFSPLRDDADMLLPAAAYLRYDMRRDGWTAGRQAACLSHLADHGIAEDAVRSVGMSPGGAYAFRRRTRGYLFNLGWEAALLIARRIVADNLMTAAIRGERSVWLREEGKTTFTRNSAKLSLTLLDRVTEVESLDEVLAVVARFDWFLQLLDDGVSPEDMWSLFFDSALRHREVEARHRVRAGLLLSEESDDFDDEDVLENGDIEYKSIEGAPSKMDEVSSHVPKAAGGQHMKARRSTKSGEARWTLHRGGKARLLKNKEGFGQARPLHGFVCWPPAAFGTCESKSPKVDAANQSAYLSNQARPGREAQSNKMRHQTYPDVTGSF